jgi:hypothetical protein
MLRIERATIHEIFKAKKAPAMNLSDMHFPRQLEVDDSAGTIRQALLSRTVKLSEEDPLFVPLLPVDDRMKKALGKARLQRRVRVGFEDVTEKLAAEKKGLAELRQKTAALQNERISRLLLFSNDCAHRFCREIAQILISHEPRILGCRLDIDGEALGKLITGKSGIIKVILIEHKDAVSDVLRVLVPNKVQSYQPDPQ